MKSFVLGESTNGLPIWAHEFGSGLKPIVILAAHHGDEIEGTALANALLAKWHSSYDYRLRSIVVPTLNVDGQLLKQRWNSRGVDLNRNLPTKDWTSTVLNPRYNPGPHAASECESRILIQLIESEKPSFVLSLHSYFPMFLVNGDGLEEAQLLSQFIKSQVKADVGYPTPGSLGTYCIENNYPCITWEIERGLALSEIVKTHVHPVGELMKHLEKKYGY